MGVLLSILSIALYLYSLLLLARIIIELIVVLRDGWRPRGAAVVAFEVVYTLTDPPVRLFRKIIPPVRVGSVSLDFGVAASLFAVYLAMMVVSAF